MKKSLIQLMSMLASVLLIVALFIPTPAAAREITVGIIIPITGPLAMFGQPTSLGMKDVFQDANDRSTIPGIKFQTVIYDTKYDAAKTAPAYHYVKSKGANVNLTITLQDVEAIKPLAEEDEIPLVAYNSSVLSAKLPSWAFSQTPFVETIARTTIKWIVSNWDYKKEGRPPNIATIGWDNALGNTYVTGAEALAKSLQMKGKVNWVGKIIVPPRTVDYLEPARSLHEWKTDWLAVGCIPPATIPLMKLRQANNYKFKMIWGDWGQVMWGFVKARAGDAAAGHYWITTFGWWNQPGPGVQRAKELLKKYRTEEEIKKLHINEGVEYFMGMVLGDAVIKGVRNAALKVGPKKVNGRAIYNALQHLYLDPQGLASPLTWTTTKRTGSDLVRVYEIQSDGEPVPVSKWFDLVHK